MARLRVQHRFERVSLVVLVLGSSLCGAFVACSGDPEIAQNPGTGGTSGSAGNDAGACFSGQFRCEGSVARRCDGSGQLGEAVDCQKSGAVCTDLLGCVACIPGAKSCKDGIGTWCRADGTEARFDCDPDQGMACAPDGCTGACSAPELADTYLGCDYYPTVTLNPVWSGFPFAVAVANAGQSAARVIVTRARARSSGRALRRADSRCSSCPG